MGRTIRGNGLGGYKTNTPFMYGYPNIWTWLALEIGVKSVIDIGCAEGHVLNFFKFFGCRVHGVDGCQYAYENSMVKDDMVLHDYRNGSYIPNDTYELGWSSDFVEHVDSQFVSNYMETFNKCSKYVFLTFGPLGCRGYHHVNCNNLPYWIDLFAAISFKPNYELTEQATKISMDGGKLTPEVKAAFPDVANYKSDVRAFSGTKDRQTGIVFDKIY